jgi:hypothetical protein
MCIDFGPDNLKAVKEDAKSTDIKWASGGKNAEGEKKEDEKKENKENKEEKVVAVPGKPIFGNPFQVTTMETKGTMNRNRQMWY